MLLPLGQFLLPTLEGIPALLVAVLVNLLRDELDAQDTPEERSETPVRYAPQRYSAPCDGDN